MVVIEFAGLQTSGKSSIAAGMVTALQALGVRVGTRSLHSPPSRAGSLSRVRKAIMRRPSVVMRSAAYLMALRPPRPARLYAQLIRASELACLDTELDAVILDEGVIHRVFLDSIGRVGNSIPRVAPLLRAAYDPIPRQNLILVYVDIEASEALRRLSLPTHAHCIYNRVSRDRAIQLVDEGIARYPALYEMAVCTLGALGLRIDGLDSTEANVNLVTRLVLRTLRCDGMQVDIRSLK